MLITNCDNVDAAEALELSRYRFIPHPINERTLPPRGFREELREHYDADFLVFHPSRQHWDARRDPSWEKGNDVFLRGFAAFLGTGTPRAAAILVNWGATVEASRQLIRELGIEGRVHWIEPQPHLAMAEYIEACDVVADQFYLGAFGSTTPKAMFLERPVLLNLDADRHRWAFPELPPVCHAETDEQVANHLQRLADDPAYARDLGRQFEAVVREVAFEPGRGEHARKRPLRCIGWSMRVLLFGATGYLGSALASATRRSGTRRDQLVADKGAMNSKVAGRFVSI